MTLFYFIHIHSVIKISSDTTPFINETILRTLIPQFNPYTLEFYSSHMGRIEPDIPLREDLVIITVSDITSEQFDQFLLPLQIVNDHYQFTFSNTVPDEPLLKECLANYTFWKKEQDEEELLLQQMQEPLFTQDRLPILFRQVSNPNDPHVFQKLDHEFPSLVRVQQPKKDHDLIVYSLRSHGEMITPIEEIHTYRLLDKPFVISKDGLLGLYAYNTNRFNLCLSKNPKIVHERFTIFPNHILAKDQDERFQSELRCCDTNTLLFSLDTMKQSHISLKQVIRKLLRYHTIHFPNKGILLRCDMCSSQSTVHIFEYLLWEAKIYHQIIYLYNPSEESLLQSYIELYHHYKDTKTIPLSEQNVKNMMFVFKQFNHLFSSSINTFIYQVRIMNDIHIKVWKASHNENNPFYELDIILSLIQNARIIITILSKYIKSYPHYNEELTSIFSAYKKLISRFTRVYRTIRTQWNIEVKHKIELDSFLQNEAINEYSYMNLLDNATKEEVNVSTLFSFLQKINKWQLAGISVSIMLFLLSHFSGRKNRKSKKVMKK